MTDFRIKVSKLPTNKDVLSILTSSPELQPCRELTVFINSLVIGDLDFEWEKDVVSRLHH